MEESDKIYNGHLIDEYQRLQRIKESAIRENADETVKLIEKEISFIRLKLQPLELPEE
jgi:hypothetical protein